MQDVLIPHHKFADRELAEDNPVQFDRYVEARLKGTHQNLAFRQAFGDLDDIQKRAMFCEFNPWVSEQFELRLAAMKPEQLWSPNRAVHSVLSMARDPFAKCSTQLAAMKELNVMCNITIIDENGKTRAGRTLADFYKANETAEQPKENV